MSAMIVAVTIGMLVIGALVGFVLTRPRSWVAPDGVYREVPVEDGEQRQ